MFALAWWAVSKGSMRTGAAVARERPSGYPWGSSQPASTQGTQLASAAESTSFAPPRWSRPSGQALMAAPRCSKWAGSQAARVAANAVRTASPASSSSSVSRRGRRR